MKPIKNTIPSLLVGNKIRHKEWPVACNDQGYYEIAKITMKEGFQVVHLKDFDVNYIIKDLSMWEWV